MTGSIDELTGITDVRVIVPPIIGGGPDDKMLSRLAYNALLLDIRKPKGTAVSVIRGVATDFAKTERAIIVASVSDLGTIETAIRTSVLDKRTPVVYFGTANEAVPDGIEGLSRGKYVQISYAKGEIPDFGSLVAEIDKHYANRTP